MKGKLKQAFKWSWHKDRLIASTDKICFGGVHVWDLKHWFKLTHHVYCRQVFCTFKSEQDKRSTDSRVITSMKKMPFFKKYQQHRQKIHDADWSKLGPCCAGCSGSWAKWMRNVWLRENSWLHSHYNFSGLVLCTSIYSCVSPAPGNSLLELTSLFYVSFSPWDLPSSLLQSFLCPKGFLSCNL